jgi:DNA uptake protein ComE-like DNA-binding protein
LVGVWQAAQGTLTLPEGVKLDPDVKLIMPHIFLKNFTDPYPDVPASMLPTEPVNINTASRDVIMSLPLGGGMRTMNQRADAILNTRPFSSLEDLEDVIGKVGYLNCKSVGITIEDNPVVAEEPFVAEVLEGLNDFAEKLEEIEEVKGVGKVVGARIKEHFNK